MSGVFRNIAPPPPHRPASVTPPPLVRGEDTLAGRRGGSIVRKTPDTACSVLYICKYFVGIRMFPEALRRVGRPRHGLKHWEIYQQNTVWNVESPIKKEKKKCVNHFSTFKTQIKTKEIASRNEILQFVAPGTMSHIEFKCWCPRGLGADRLQPGLAGSSLIFQ